MAIINSEFSHLLMLMFNSFLYSLEGTSPLIPIIPLMYHFHPILNGLVLLGKSTPYASMVLVYFTEVLMFHRGVS